MSAVILTNYSHSPPFPLVRSHVWPGAEPGGPPAPQERRQGQQPHLLLGGLQGIPSQKVRTIICIRRVLLDVSP